MTNFKNENGRIKEVQCFKYLGQPRYAGKTCKGDMAKRIRSGWSCFGR